MCFNHCRVLDTTITLLRLDLWVLGTDSAWSRERQRTADSTPFFSPTAQILARPWRRQCLSEDRWDPRSFSWICFTTSLNCSLRLMVHFVLFTCSPRSILFQVLLFSSLFPLPHFCCSLRLMFVAYYCLRIEVILSVLLPALSLGLFSKTRNNTAAL